MNRREALALVALGALVVVCATVLVALHRDVPVWFASLAVAGAAGGAGLAVPGSSKSSGDVAAPAPAASPGHATGPSSPNVGPDEVPAVTT